MIFRRTRSPQLEVSPNPPSIVACAATSTLLSPVPQRRLTDTLSPSRLPHPKDLPPLPHHQVRNLGHSRARALRLPCAHVLPQRASRPRRLRHYQAHLPDESETLGRRAPAP